MSLHKLEPNLKNIRYGPTFPDFVLLAVIVGLSVGLMAFIGGEDGVGGKEALVYQGNKLVETVNLADKHHRFFTLGKTRIEVVDGAIKIAESDCPRSICSHKGWIGKPGETIVCVPNKIMIEIKGRPRSGEYNAISY